MFQRLFLWQDKPTPPAKPQVTIAPLCSLSSGNKGIVCAIQADPLLQQQLGNFGITEGCRICVRNHSDPMTLDIGNSCIAISKEALKDVQVLTD